MNFPEETIKAWMARVRHLCCRWRSHPQFDDIVACAYLGMWRALQHADDTPGRDHTPLALQGAYTGALKFFRDPVCVTSTYTCKGNERPEVLSLSDWQTLWSSDTGAVSQPYEPDFAPRVIEWLAAQDELAKLPAKKRRALVLGCIYLLSRKEIGEEMGLDKYAVSRLLKGIDVIPTHYGNPAYRP